MQSLTRHVVLALFGCIVSSSHATTPQDASAVRRAAAGAPMAGPAVMRGCCTEPPSGLNGWRAAAGDVRLPLSATAATPLR